MKGSIFKSQAPGSLMLIGEHAVLRGSIAMVVAIDQWVRVTLIPRKDKTVIIHSALGKYITTLSNLKIQPPFTFVLAALALFQKKFLCGFHIKIQSDFSATIGFGSSAAVTVAVVKVCQQWLDSQHTQRQTFHLARKAMLSVQKIGSGADIAASVYGGIVSYQMKPLKMQHMQNNLSIVAVYSGKKTPTLTVLKKVAVAEAKNPKKYKIIFSDMKKIALQAKRSLVKKDMLQFFDCLKKYQIQMVRLGVSNTTLNRLVTELEKRPGIGAAKISGSGLGDCVIGIGSLPLNSLLKRRAKLISNSVMHIEKCPYNTQSLRIAELG